MLKNILASKFVTPCVVACRGAATNASCRLFSSAPRQPESETIKAEISSTPLSSPISEQQQPTPTAGSEQPAKPFEPTATDLEFFARLNKNAAAIKQKESSQFESALDDTFGVQKNWFRSLHRQLKIIHTADNKAFSGASYDDVFKKVEGEFEVLYQKYMKNRGYEGNAHRGMLLCCLAVATQRVLSFEIPQDSVVKEIIRINLGGTAMIIMRFVQKFRLFLLFRLFVQDPYKIATATFPTLKEDFSSVVQSEVAVDDRQATWTVHNCEYSKILMNEDCLDLHSEFCCHFSHRWLEMFSPYGVEVTQDKCMKWDDGCCQLRVTKLNK